MFLQYQDHRAAELVAELDNTLSHRFQAYADITNRAIANTSHYNFSEELQELDFTLTQKKAELHNRQLISGISGVVWKRLQAPGVQGFIDIPLPHKDLLVLDSDRVIADQAKPAIAAFLTMVGQLHHTWRFHCFPTSQWQIQPLADLEKECIHWAEWIIITPIEQETLILGSHRGADRTEHYRALDILLYRGDLNAMFADPARLTTINYQIISEEGLPRF